MTASDPVLAVVIGTLNRREQLRQAIESIFAETTVSVRVYVTDAGSTDGTLEYLQGLGDPRVVPVLEGRRLGQATAYNRVFRTLRTKHVCWLSDDNVIVNRGLDEAVAILEGDASVGLVALKVRDRQGPFVEAPYIGGISPLGILNVNQGVLRTADLLRVGGFSEWFQLYGIDPDLTAKILLGGGDVVYTRNVSIHHYRNWPADPKSPEFARVMEQQKVSQQKYLLKYGGLLPPSRRHEAKKRLWAWIKRRRPELAFINSGTRVGCESGFS